MIYFIVIIFTTTLHFVDKMNIPLFKVLDYFEGL